METSQTIKRPVALVTGGRRGIGAAIVRTLAQAGFDVAFTGRSADAVSQQLVTEIEALGVRGLALASELQDVAAHPALVAQVAEWGGGIHCLVNNAGIGSPVRGDLLDVTPEALDLVMETNLRGTFFLTQLVARQMLAQKDELSCSIVTVSSVSADMASIERGEYCMSKAALGMLTKLFALRLAAHDIGVFEVRPGIIRTDLTAGVAAKYEKQFETGLVPVARWGEPEEIAHIVRSLADRAFRFATGSVVYVDGGLSIPRF
ncbi:3-ketoacyl-ACP reductase [Leeia oryzae]|uniref:3-ketoacyl-ACP reductase n=1 Tax=Leeia oryzae TaxID=356662 RepID=UPI00036EF112|nr:3-ketoacyl-ACP reductase [Leeia oryzae]